MDGKVPRLLNRLERKNNIEILCAVECGSRAYGLASHSSDYDKRYIYIQNDRSVYWDDYLKPRARSDRWKDGLHDCSDVTLKTITGKSSYPDGTEIDHHGWDITKALKHLHEMNPSIVEWVFSPIVYYDDGLFLKRARQLLRGQNRTAPLFRHYRSMARTHFDDYISSEYSVRIKKYIVCARCCVMFKWLEYNQQESWAPLIQVDLNQVLQDLDGYFSYSKTQAIYSLISLKKRNGKYDLCKRKPALDDLILEVLQDTSHNDDENYPKQRAYNKLLDTYFVMNFRNLRF